MTSILRKSIAEKYHLYNNQKMTTKELKQIEENEKIQLKDLCQLFDIRNTARFNCLNGKECRFYIRIYTDDEMKEIKEKIKNDLQQIGTVMGSILEFLKEKYRISSRDMIRILGTDYAKYKKAENQSQSLEPQWDDNKSDNQASRTTYSEKEKQECRNQISNIKKYKVSKKVIEQIAKEKEISFEEAGEILGLKKEKIEKIKEEKQLTVKMKDEKKKRIVEFLKLDIKYLASNGERYYKTWELLFFSKEYHITVDDMFYYLADSKTMYETYQEAYKNNLEGVWIGKKGRLSNEYLEMNYDILNKYIARAAKNISFQYQCNSYDEEDFRAIVFEYLINNGGFYEKNLSHNPEMLNKVLVKNAQFIMKSYYLKSPKELSLTLRFENKEVDDETALADNRYNPEICYLEEKYSYLKEIESVHREIVENIAKNSFFAIDYPEEYFAKNAGKYHMTKEMLEGIMDEIRAWIIKNKVAKIDKTGRVIPMFYVDD